MRIFIVLYGYMADAEFFQFKKLLKNKGNFITAPRVRLFSMLQHNPALTMKQLVKLTNKHDQSTVYRNINLFEELGIINRLRLGWHSKVELSDIFRHHHHHMSCVNCGKVWRLREDPIIEAHIAHLSEVKNFKAMEHQLEIRGQCNSCQKI